MCACPGRCCQRILGTDCTEWKGASACTWFVGYVSWRALHSLRFVARHGSCRWGARHGSPLCLRGPLRTPFAGKASAHADARLRLDLNRGLPSFLTCKPICDTLPLRKSETSCPLMAAWGGIARGFPPFATVLPPFFSRQLTLAEGARSCLTTSVPSPERRNVSIGREHVWPASKPSFAVLRVPRWCSLPLGMVPSDRASGAAARSAGRCAPRPRAGH